MDISLRAVPLPCGRGCLDMYRHSAGQGLSLAILAGCVGDIFRAHEWEGEYDLGHEVCDEEVVCILPV